MYKFELNPEAETKEFSVKHMQPGQIGTIKRGKYAGEVVLKTFNQIVCLRQPDKTWNDPDNCGLAVELLPKGSKITLTVED